MLADYFTKSLKGVLFVRFCEVIMGYKHKDTLYMEQPSTKECDRNVVEIEKKRNQIQCRSIRRRYRKEHVVGTA